MMRKNRYILLTLLCCLIFSGCGASISTSVGKPDQFKLGSETFELGTSTTDDIRKHYDVTAETENALVLDIEGEAAVGFDDSGRIISVSANSTSFEGYKGICIGQTEQEIVNKLGSYSDSTSYYTVWVFKKNGTRLGLGDAVQALLNGDDAIYGISIFFDGGKASGIMIESMTAMDLDASPYS